MLAVTDLSAWLTGLGVTDPVLDGYWMPPQPDRVVFVQMAGGTGLQYQGAFDQITFQVRSRGLQRNPADAGILAGQVDALILATFPPLQIGGVNISDVDRLGAPPRFQMLDTAFRSEWICNYVLSAARS